MNRFAVAARFVMGAGIVAAVVATFFDTASRSAINPFNFFGFFTMQSNIFGAAVLLYAAVTGWRALAAGRSSRQPPALVLVRACMTTYLVVVGIVYNTLLAGLPGGVELAWANTVLHVIAPLYVAIDWVVFRDREPLQWKSLGVVLIYPVVWLTVILIRGATDGFVPYPFLDPAPAGYGRVVLYCVAIALSFGIIGAGVWAVSRSGAAGRTTATV